jgi:small-conductance mechanosensitive channel
VNLHLNNVSRNSARICVWILLACAHSVAAEDQSEADAVASDEQAATVVVDGNALFKVAGSASFPSQRRARDIGQRIVAEARNPAVSTQDVQLQPQATRVDIVAVKRHVVAVVAQDAELDGLSLTDAAQFRAQKIKDAIQRYRAERTTDYLLRSSLNALCALIAAGLAIFLLLKALQLVHRAIERRYGERVRSVTVSSFELVRAETIWRGIRTLISVVRVALIVTVSFLGVAFALGQFPWSRDLSDQLVSVVSDPASQIAVSIFQYIPKLVFLVLLWFLVRYALRLTGVFTRAVATGAVPLKGFDADWAHPTYHLVRAGIVLLALVIAYPYLPGSGSAAFQGLSIFAGLMLSLGASSAMASVIAGYTVTYRRAFRVGDRVSIGDLVGEVTEVRLMVTHLRTPKNEEIVVPNSLVLSSHVVNFTKLAAERGLILHTDVNIGYDTPWRQVEALLLQAADRTQGLMREPAPFVLQKSLDQFSIAYELNVYVNTTQRLFALYSSLHRNILDVFNEYGIQIMVPAYEGDPEHPKIVAKEAWFTSPAAKSLGDVPSHPTAEVLNVNQ